MKSYAQWLNSLIEDLNTDTFIEEPWSVEFVDQDGKNQHIGNSRIEMKKNNGIWVFFIDKDQSEFGKIRAYLQQAQTILKVNRIGRNGNGKVNLPSHYENVFRIDTIIKEHKEMAILLDRNDNIIDMMTLQESIDFTDHFAVPVSILDFRSRFEDRQYVSLEEGLLTPINITPS